MKLQRFLGIERYDHISTQFSINCLPNSNAGLNMIESFIDFLHGTYIKEKI